MSGQQTARKPHPKAAGIERIRVSLHRPADGTGDIIAVCDGGLELHETARAGGGSRPGQGWRADLVAAHPSLAEGHSTWKNTARELGDRLTESVRDAGPWRE